MRIYALIAALFVAGLTASFALGATSRHGDGTTTTGTTTTPHPKCQAVALSGAASSGSVAFAAKHTSKNAAKLAGTNVTLAIPSGARVLAIACTDASGALTLRSLTVVSGLVHPVAHGPADAHEGGNHQ
jgi:hypothetical protein